MGLEGLIEDDLSGDVDLLGPAIVDAGGRHHADAAVPVQVQVVVPVEVAAAEAACILDGAEPIRNPGLYLSVLNCDSEYGLSSEI